MPKQSCEEIKDESRGLRGKIVETLLSDASHFEEAEYQLLKFHGSYQQDNRDSRSERRKQKLDKEWMFMVRTKMPSGTLTAQQYLAHDDMAEKLGNATMRLTSRQGIQLHGILKGGLRDTVRAIANCGMTSWGACGDVVRNTMAPGTPVNDKAHSATRLLADEISERFMARTTAYSSIWLDGEKLDLAVDEAAGEVEEPIYGKYYLPRKFKIGIAVPPCNDVDLFSQDVGFIAHLEDGEVIGYSIHVGGGFGMSHGKVETYPCLAQPLFYCAAEHAAAACEAIVTIHRDYGDRSDRKHARVKYLVAERGIEWFRHKVEERIDFPSEPVREVQLGTVADTLGWHTQGDGKYFVGVYVAQGRVIDSDAGKTRSAFRKIAGEIDCSMRVTANANMYFYDIRKEDRDRVNSILSEHELVTGKDFTALRQMGHACVALPTCGLALSESERVFTGLLDSVDGILEELGLSDDPILMRMTGCPNGCARPYNADFAFVGRAPGKYAMFVGGSSAGNRLASLEKKIVLFDDIPGEIRGYLDNFVKQRQNNETFSEYWGRTRPETAQPNPEQFHLEQADRNPS
ncbi:MAG: NADPH-dependent assimilatory sulfite reductase hemoprotein subunit [Verrucomicrobiaceae bacterium]|nr:NADPH-dependent assimilatory sulfite reductase hemoprotein subunit [Verrucomicrobiaceae bacterium]